MAEIPQYTIRESVRAKHVILKISLHDGLVVVVPQGFDLRRVPKIIDEKREWIERKAKRIEHKKRVLAADAGGVLPEHISLKAVSEEWRVDYERGVPSKVTLTWNDDRHLLISGDIEDRSLVRTVLRRFLVKKARIDLVDLLQSLADQHGFTVSKVSARLQKTRWGTCSTRDAISLNAKLLLLPRDLVDYVMIHELCHTVHHNHSREFWQLMQEHLPQARTLRQTLLDDAWRYVPLWLEGMGS